MISRLLSSDLWRFLLPSTQGMGGTPQPSMEKPHAKSPSRVDLNLKPLIQLQNHCQCEPLPPLSALRSRSAFSLVELLVVMGIIATMVGLSVLALQGMRAPAVQHAAEQVMSGLSLARQVAITKNTKAAFLIANDTNTGFPTNGPYRHWSVVYFDRQINSWRFAKNWEELPNGVFILETRGQSGASYSPIGGNPLDDDYDLGDVTPDKFDEDDFTISGSLISDVPNIMFSTDGSASSAAIAVRIAQGAVLNGNATLTSTNNYYFVETDGLVGRIRMRSPESYNNP